MDNERKALWEVFNYFVNRIYAYSINNDTEEEYSTTIDSVMNEWKENRAIVSNFVILDNEEC